MIEWAAKWLSRRTLPGIAVCILAAAPAVLWPGMGWAASSAAASLHGQQPVPAQRTAPPPAQPTPVAQPSITAYTLQPDKYRQAVGYAHANNLLYFIGFFYGLIVLFLVLGWRLGPRYRNWAERATPRRLGQAVIFAPLLLLTLAVLGLPVDVVSQWVELHYQQSVQGWGSWLWDWTKAQLVGYVLASFLVWILYGVIRRSVRRWWFYFWLAALPIMVFLVFIAPIVFAPLFNKFEPLQKTDPALVSALEKVTIHAGRPIPPDRMFLMKASEKVNSLNAYVSGFGASKRVVVWDTTIKDMTTPEIAFVFGHEMGHYVLNHIAWGLAYGAVGLLVLLWLGYLALGWSLRHWGGRWAVRGVEDWASLPTLLLWFSIISFLAAPLTNAVSRHFEHEADRYGLEVTHGLIPDSAQNAARAFQILGEVDLSDPHPNPFIVFWLYNHPPDPERVQFALHYDPWAPGHQPRYVP